MTTTIHRTAAAAACIAAIIAGAAACGTEDGTTSMPTAAEPGSAPASTPHATAAATPTPDFIEAQKASQAAYIHQISARHEAAQRARHQRGPRQHPTGFDKAIRAER